MIGGKNWRLMNLKDRRTQAPDYGYRQKIILIKEKGLTGKFLICFIQLWRIWTLNLNIYNLTEKTILTLTSIKIFHAVSIYKINFWTTHSIEVYCDWKNNKYIFKTSLKFGERTPKDLPHWKLIIDIFLVFQSTKKS